MPKLTITQQAQIAAVLGTRPDTEVLSGMHQAYCVSGILTDMLTCDDEEWFDRNDINIHADDFDIFGHGELCCTEYWNAFDKVSNDREAVMEFAYPLAKAIKAK